MNKILIAFCIIISSLLAQDNNKPNILFIMSDDHAAHAIGAYGGRLAKLNPTPVLDQLAKEGALFTNAYCTNSICAPSRASIITGQYPHTHRVTDLYGGIKGEKQFLPIELKKAGYHTAMIGKWHLKREPSAFDFYSVLPGQGKFFNPEFKIKGKGEWPKNIVKYDGKHSTDVITDQSIDWLKEKWNKEKPFFLMHHYKAPHDYFENALRYQSYLKDVDIPQPESLHEPFSEDFGSIATRGHNNELIRHIGTSIGGRNVKRSYLRDLPRRFPDEFPENFNPTNYTAKEINTMCYNAYLRKYLRCVKGIDDNLARLFQHLKDIGQYDNTVIIYTGDQGFMLGEHDYQDKRWMYQESQQMPFIVRFPKSIKAGIKPDAIIENVDFAPTMLDFAGIKTPTYMQGKSVKSICETGKEPEGWKQAAYYRYWMHMAHHFNPAHIGIRTKEFKLIYFYGCNYHGKNQTPPAWELYNVKRDPQEHHNVYENPEYKDVIKQLKVELAQLRENVGDNGKLHPKSEAIIQEFWDYDSDDKAKAISISNEIAKRSLTPKKKKIK